MINSMDNINKEDIIKLLHDALNLKLLCERRGLEKIDAEKRGFRKDNRIEFVEFNENDVIIQVTDSGYDLRDIAQISLNIDEICMIEDSWKLHLQRL